MNKQTKGSHSLLKGFYHIKHAEECFLDFLREHPDARVYSPIKVYTKKLNWMQLDFRTLPSMPTIVSEGMRKEFSGDILFPTAIAEKCLLLPEEQRENFEYLLDRMIAGEKLEIIKEE